MKNRSLPSYLLLAAFVILSAMGFPPGLRAAPTKVTPAVPTSGVPVGFSPDGARLIYYTNNTTTARSDLYSVRVDGSDAAAPVQLNTQPLAKSGINVETIPVVTAAGRVLFTAGTSFKDLFSNSVSGGDLQQLTTGKSISGKGTDDGIAFPAFLISPDGTKLAFRAPDANLRNQVFTVPLMGGALTQVTSGFANAQASAGTFRWVGNTAIAYRADADQSAMYELYVRAANGTGAVTKINFNFGAAAAGGTGLNPKVKENFAVSDDGARLLYMADPTHTVGSSASFPFNLYSAPVGGGTSTQLNPAGSSVQSARNYLVSGPLVAFLASSTSTSLYRAPVSPPGGWTGAVLVSSSPYEFRIAPDQTSVVFTTTSAKSDLLQQTGSGAAHVISDTSSASYTANPNVATRNLMLGADGQSIYYTVSYSGGATSDDSYSIWKAPRAEGAPQELVAGMTGSNLGSGVISSDGAWIYFSLYPTGASVQQHYVLSTATGQVRQLVDPDGNSCRPTFASTGTVVAFQGTESGTKYLFCGPPDESYASWLVNQRLPTNGTGLGAPDATPANDGIKNRMKFALGIQPGLSGYQDHLGHSTATFSGKDYLTLTYQRPEPAPAGVTYTVKTSGDLISWSAVETAVVSSSAVGAFRTIVIRDTIGIQDTPRRFIRLEVGP